MLFVNVPYCPVEKGQDLGFAYNSFMETIGEDDWALFLDHDAMFTTVDWYPQVEEIIEQNQDVGVFSCLTNRIGNPLQKLNNIDDDNHNIKYHRRIGYKLKEGFEYEVHRETTLTNWLMSGVILLISKRTWRKVKGFKSGFLGVDNDIHRRCLQHNLPVGIMKGVYVYHWYRGDGDMGHIREEVR